MNDDFIDYGQLIDDAMHIIVKKALERVSEGGLPGKHHFFISFLSEYPGVEISDELKSKYPEEMTIVLQHQFEDLVIKEDKFSVALSFDNVQEKIVIPFEALVAFADPSVKFGLQFRHVDEDDLSDMGDLEGLELLAESGISPNHDDEDAPKKIKPATKSKKKPQKGKKTTNVVDIDAFRKK